MNAPKQCPNCGKPLPASTLDGLCPECMLRVSALADSVPEPLTGPNDTVVATSVKVAPLVAPRIGENFGRYRVLRRLEKQPSERFRTTPICAGRWSLTVPPPRLQPCSACGSWPGSLT